jgi:hypothetical protein
MNLQCDGLDQAAPDAWLMACAAVKGGSEMTTPGRPQGLPGAIRHIPFRHIAVQAQAQE